MNASSFRTMKMNPAYKIPNHKTQNLEKRRSADQNSLNTEDQAEKPDWSPLRIQQPPFEVQ